MMLGGELGFGGGNLIGVGLSEAAIACTTGIEAVKSFCIITAGCRVFGAALAIAIVGTRGAGCDT